MPKKYSKDNSVTEFWSKMLKQSDDGCWNWSGALVKGGYGQATNPITKRRSVAHRVAYELTNGPIPDGLFVCHSCDNPPCCNPTHLWLGTNKDNMQDMVRKGRSTKGIKLSAEHIKKAADARRGFKHSEETKKRWSETRKGRSVSAATREQCRISALKRWERKRLQVQSN